MFPCSALFGALSEEQLEHSLVLVHIGERFPRYLPDAIAQARSFNPDSPIFLIGNAIAFEQFINKDDVIPVPIESLTPSRHHTLFATKATKEAFWRYTLERFLVLDDFIQQYDLRHVFHIENDVMLYFDLKERLPSFQICYTNQVATTFDCDQRSVPSLVYIDNPSVSNLLAKFIALHATESTTDMLLLSLFKDFYYQKRADHLPILIPAYADDYPLTNIFKDTAKDPEPFSAYLDEMQMIFDAAALGQFFGGIDPILGQSKPGFLGEASVFLPMFFEFTWIQDTKQRWIPYISYKGETYPIANLHIHCKDLARFRSTNKTPPIPPTEFYSSLPFDHIQSYLQQEELKKQEELCEIQ